MARVKGITKKKCLSFILSVVLALTTIFGAIGTAVFTKAETETDSSALILSKVAQVVDGEDNTYKVTLSVSGKNATTTTEVVVALDLSHSMTAGTRFADTIAAAKKTVESLLSNEYTTVTLVTYGKEATNQGSYTVDSRDDLISLLDTLEPFGSGNTGTNIQAALYQARLQLEESSADNKYVLLMTDGAATNCYYPNINYDEFDINDYYVKNSNGTYIFISRLGTTNKLSNKGTIFVSDYTINSIDYSNLCTAGQDPSKYAIYTDRTDYTCTKDGVTKTVKNVRVCYENIMSECTNYEADLLKDAGVEIYSIGVAITSGSYAATLISDIASSEDNVVLATDDNISEQFVEITGKMMNAAEEAEVTDPMGDNFNLVIDENTSSVEVSQGYISYNDETDTIEWSIGTVTEGNPATMTYIVVVDPDKIDTMDPDETYPTNKDTYITYINNKGEQTTQYFDVPSVSLTKGSIAVNYVLIGEDNTKTVAKTEYVNSANELVDSYVNIGYGTYSVNADLVYGTNYVFADFFYNKEQVDGNTLSVDVTKSNPTQTVDIVYKEVTKQDVTIKYYKDEISTDNYLGQITLQDQGVGDAITLTDNEKTQYAPIGYTTPGTIISDDDCISATVVSAFADENVVYIVYSKNLYAYEVNYYIDSVSDENKLDVSNSGTALYGSSIEYDADANCPTGYTLDSIDKTSGFIGTVTENVEDNTITILYKKADYGYTVNYYKDSTQGGVTGDNYLGNITGTATYQSTVDIDNTLYQPEGYEAGVVSKDLVISVDENSNVVNVVYSDKQLVGYVIEYYKDLVSDTPIGTVKVNDAEYEATITLTDTDKNTYKPTGYSDGEIVEGSATTVSSAKQSENIVKVLYVKNTYSYTVNYYLEDEEEPFKTVTTTGTFGDAITYVANTTDFEETIRNNYSNFEGYEVAGIVNYADGGDGTITDSIDKNVVNVTFNKAEVAYTIEYYKEVYDETTNSMKVVKAGEDVTGSAKYQTNINYISDIDDTIEISSDSGVDVEVDKYYPEEGYLTTISLTKKPTKIGKNTDDNTIIVAYRLAKYPVIVQYYYENEIDEASTYVYEQYYGTKITSYDDKVKEGFELDRVEGIGENVTSGNNVVNVYYKKSNYGYQVDYYLEGSDVPFFTEIGEAEYESSIPYINSAEILVDESPEYETILVGYDEYASVEFVEGGDGTIKVKESLNVVNVTFTKAYVDYYITYLKQVVNEETGEIEEVEIASIDESAHYGSSVSYKSDLNIISFALDSEEAVVVDVDAYYPGDEYQEDVLVKGPTILGLNSEDNKITITYQLVVSEDNNDEPVINPTNPTIDEGDVAADETDVIKEEGEVAVDEGEVAADEIVEVVAETVEAGEVAADTTQTGDSADLIIFIAIMMFAGSFVVVTSKRIRKAK